MQCEGVPPDKISILRHFVREEIFRNVDPIQMARIRDVYDLTGHGPIIDSISRLDEWKGLKHTTDAHARLLDQYPNALLVIANATGPFRSAINAQLSSLPNSSWRLIPFESSVAALYSCFDLFIHVAVEKDVEAFGQVYIEALAAGIPSIFTASGVAAEFAIHMTNCWLSPPADPQHIYRGMLTLLTDRELRASITNEGRRLVRERYTSVVLGEQHALVYPAS